MARSSVATDDFGSGLGNFTSVNPDWGTLSITSGAFHGTAGNPTNDQCAQRSAETYADDQYASIELVNSFAFNGENYSVGCGVRCSSDTNSSRDYYKLTVHETASSSPFQTRLTRVVNGSHTILKQADEAWAINDLLELEVEGDTLRCMKNGSLIDTDWEITDTSLTTGKPCITGSAGASVRGDNADFGDITGASGIRIAEGGSAALAIATSGDVKVAVPIAAGGSAALAIATSGDVSASRKIAAGGSADLVVSTSGDAGVAVPIAAGGSAALTIATSGDVQIAVPIAAGGSADLVVSTSGNVQKDVAGSIRIAAGGSAALAIATSGDVSASRKIAAGGSADLVVSTSGDAGVAVPVGVSGAGDLVFATAGAVQVAVRIAAGGGGALVLATAGEALGAHKITGGATLALVTAGNVSFESEFIPGLEGRITFPGGPGRVRIPQAGPRRIEF